MTLIADISKIFLLHPIAMPLICLSRQGSRRG
ncbi:MAG: hypothetical protein ACI9FG_002076 [Crocinitomicaceae bacterium]|jgi:hypothetical protein